MYTENVTFRVFFTLLAKKVKGAAKLMDIIFFLPILKGPFAKKDQIFVRSSL